MHRKGKADRGRAHAASPEICHHRLRGARECLRDRRCDVLLCRHPPRCEQGDAASDDQRPGGSCECRSHGPRGGTVDLAILGKAGPVMVEGSMDYPVGFESCRAQDVEVFQRAAQSTCADGRELCAMLPTGSTKRWLSR